MSELTQTVARRHKAFELATRALNQFAQFLDDYSIESPDDARALADLYLDQLREDMDDITGRTAGQNGDCDV